ncbi:MAG TPA: adenylate kinase [Bacteroidales bacterium]|nr:adenylate kinase [Bacteroidales bacterium]
MVNFLIFGPPGSGKGTQSVQLAEKYRLIHLSTGDMLREETDAGSNLGRRVEAIMKSGELVPDEVVIELIANQIDSNTDAAGFIFDGFPRTVDQAVALGKMLSDRGQDIAKMLVLDVEHGELVKRLLSRAELSGRSDDQDVEIIENRIAVYRQKTEPVVNYYIGMGKYQPVNGMGEIADIFERLSEIVEENI